MGHLSVGTMIRNAVTVTKGYSSSAQQHRRRPRDPCHLAEAGTMGSMMVLPWSVIKANLTL